MSTMDPDKLVAFVQKMRDLGVEEYEEGDVKIRLGPAPPPKKKEKTKQELLAEQEERRRRHHETQFAACHFIPKLSLVK